MPKSSSAVAQEDFLSWTVAFLESIGLPCRQEAGATGFLPGLAILDGVLVYDPAVPVSNLLHEAGHLALLPREYRCQAQSDLKVVMRRMLDELGPLCYEEPDGNLSRMLMQTSDPEATAWAWAAGEHLGLPPEVIIRDDEYDGEGASMRLALKMRRYAGIHGLAHAGYCVTRPDLERVSGLPAYPKLAMWVQKDVAELRPSAALIREAPRRRMRA